MAKVDRAPLFVRATNSLMIALARTGFRLTGLGKYPMYLVTVRGRTTGQPRTVLLVILERNGQRYLASPYGIVNWVLNLRVAGEATLTRGHRSEIVTARQLPKEEAALVLREEVRRGNPFARYCGVSSNSSREEFERAAIGHPLFMLETK
jgi:deazaflavin-dependent oxidoreductase (nitroreductase family)